jgi:hypothetical protein
MITVKLTLAEAYALLKWSHQEYVDMDDLASGSCALAGAIGEAEGIEAAEAEAERDTPPDAG